MVEIHGVAAAKWALTGRLMLWSNRPKGKYAGRAMRDYQAQLEKLRTDAAECKLISDLATDKAKRDLFDKLAAHLTVLADQVETAMLERKVRDGT